MRRDGLLQPSSRARSDPPVHREISIGIPEVRSRTRFCTGKGLLVACSCRHDMSWLLSIFVGLLAAVTASLEAGFVADLCVGWYRISSFEGASGYFVVFMGLFGGIVGLVVGIVCSRLAGRSFFRGLGWSLGSTAGLALLVGGISRLGADLPRRSTATIWSWQSRCVDPRGSSCSRRRRDIALRRKSSSSTHAVSRRASFVSKRRCRWRVAGLCQPRCRCRPARLRSSCASTSIRTTTSCFRCRFDRIQAEVGRQIAAAIRAVNATTTEQDPGYEGAAAVAIQFSA
jgi:hypothetical protein